MKFSLNTQNSLHVKNFGLYSLGISLVIGIIFVVSGFFLVKSEKIDHSWIRTTGTIIDAASNTAGGSGVKYAPVVQYVVDGQSYSVSSNISSSTYPVIGKEKEVAYNPDQPGQAKIVGNIGSTVFSWIFPIIGILVIVSSSKQFADAMRYKRTSKELLTNGTKVQGILTEIRPHIRAARGTYTAIVAASNTDGVVQEYISAPLTNAGSLLMIDLQANPVPVDVYLDTENPERYYVDIDDLPSLTPQRIQELIASTIEQGLK